MLSEDINIRMVAMQKELNEFSEKESELKWKNQRLESRIEDLSNNKKSYASKESQTNEIETYEKAINTENLDDYPDTNEPSLVNTLTTSLGGIPNHKGPNLLQSMAFAPSPVNESDIQSTVDRRLNNTSSNMLQKYLRGNKSKNRAIIEEDKSLARISFSTKNENSNQFNFSNRLGGLSPISSTNPTMYRKHKNRSKKRKLKKRMQNTAINVANQGPDSGKRSIHEREEEELLKSVYKIPQMNVSRPMTVPNQINNTSGTKYDDENLRESVVNIEKSEDSEFLKVQMKKKQITGPKRGWSSKHPRKGNNF